VITLPQLNTDGTETAITLPTTVPRAIDFDSLYPPPSCDGFPIIIEPELITYDFVNHYHHRDQLGTLRVTTDVGGHKIGAFDFYPFGRIIGTSEPDGSWFRFTGHERTAAGLDNMFARAKGINGAAFLSPDPGFDGWNRYSYALNDPINSTDPDGLEAVNCNSAMHWSDPECAGDPSWFGYSDFLDRYFPRSENFPISSTSFHNLFVFNAFFQTPSGHPRGWATVTHSCIVVPGPYGSARLHCDDQVVNIGVGWADESLDAGVVIPFPPPNSDRPRPNMWEPRGKVLPFDPNRPLVRPIPYSGLPDPESGLRVVPRLILRGTATAGLIFANLAIYTGVGRQVYCAGWQNGNYDGCLQEFGLTNDVPILTQQWWNQQSWVPRFSF
jgi:RHS repeat-associated protein